MHMPPGPYAETAERTSNAACTRADVDEGARRPGCSPSNHAPMPTPTTCAPSQYRRHNTCMRFKSHPTDA
jgi:hypothetical protein